MSATASQITSLTIVYSTIYLGADQRKHQSSASLVFVGGIHRWPVNSLHKGPVTRKMFPYDDVIMRTDKTVRTAWFTDTHENMMTWIHFPHYWSIVKDNLWVNGGWPLTKREVMVMRRFHFSLLLSQICYCTKSRVTGSLRRHKS